MDWNEQLQKIRKDDKDIELFKREYMCEFVKANEPYRKELINLLTELYKDNPIIQHVTDYISQDYCTKEHQPYRPLMRNILENNLSEICYNIIKYQNEEIRNLRYKLENEIMKNPHPVFNWKENK